MSIKNSSQLSLTSLGSIGEHSAVGVGCDGNAVPEDWENRQFVVTVTLGLQKISQFLNKFDKTCKVKLAQLNQKMTNLEKTITYLENRFSKENIENESIEINKE